MSLFIVRKEAVRKMPVGAREYIEKYFQETNIFGIDALICQMMLFAPRGGFKRGHGPAHSVDTHHYHKGLPKDYNLSRWFSEEAEKQGSPVYRFFDQEHHRNNDHAD